jgi:hypothetical protein
MASYNNKTKDHSSLCVYSIPIKSDESDQLSAKNNIIPIPTNTPDPAILSSREK